MNDILYILGLIAGGLTGLGVVWKLGLVPIYRFVRKIEMAHDLVLEFPIWQTEVNNSLRQLHSNGGSSIKDVVDTTKNEVSELTRLVTNHISDFEKHLTDPEAHGKNPS